MARRPPRSKSSTEARALVAAHYRRRLDRWVGTPLEGADVGAQVVLDALEAGRDVEVPGFCVPASVRPGRIQGRYRIGADNTVTAVPWSTVPKSTG